MICCDTCPYAPACDERDDFLRDLFGLDDDAEVDWQHNGYVWVEPEAATRE